MRFRFAFLACLLFSCPSWAQTTPAPISSGTWAGGTALGNGLEAHGGYLAPHWMLYSRVRYKWWGPESGPGSDEPFSSFNTRSRQLETAVLAGGVLPLGDYRAYGAAGLGYVTGRQLGEYRYTTFDDDVFTAPDPTYYYAYRSYQALGVPLELGLLGPALGGVIRLGGTFQANLNPQRSEFCLLLTAWAGRFGPAKKP